MTTATKNPAKAEKNITGAVKPTAGESKTSPTTVQHREPEDAYLTGGQRNLQRRVLGLNVDGKKAPQPSPGLHSTGSFTGVTNSENEIPRDQPAKRKG
jgi:hypothetical protein